MSIPTYLFPLSFVSLLALERFLPGRPQPHVRGWVPKALLFFLIGGVVNVGVPAAVAKAITGHALLDLSDLGLAAGVPLTLLVTSFLAYWVHRAMHHYTWLWRWTHQMHHSAERVDLAGFAYTHPFDLAVGTAVSASAVAILGIDPMVAGLSAYIAFVLGLFLHLNTRTPIWLGYVVQRPEAHAVHHQRGVHAYNYGLPIWDLAFGTFRNPRTWTGAAGFWDGASRRVGAMLVGRDVSAPPQ